MRFRHAESPFGGVLVAEERGALRWLSFEGGPKAIRVPRDWVEDDRNTLLKEATRQLAGYFKRRREEFDLPLDPQGTPFQRRVWKKLLKIPYGKTVAYSELARRIGKPKAHRAVGAANGQNPISIVIPCHRLVGKAGQLTGYGGGLDRKRALLRLEGAIPS